MELSRENNRAGLKQLAQGFDKLGLEYVPSHGNFILVRFEKADTVNEQLMKTGIIVRPVKGYDLPNHLRISVGTEPQNARLLETLSRILSMELP